MTHNIKKSKKITCKLYKASNNYNHSNLNESDALLKRSGDPYEFLYIKNY